MKIRCVKHKDNTHLFSFHRHDYKTYGEGEDSIMIDGGFDYTRYRGNLEEAELEDVFDEVRKQFLWGQNYDKEHNRLPETNWLLLKDMDMGHIVAIIAMIDNNESYTSQIFQQELKHRLK